MLAWVWRRLGWSNSLVSWQERLASLLFLAVGVLLLWKGWSWPPPLLIGAWVVYLAATVLLAREGWLKLLGPVLFYDMIRAARRTRYFLLRIAYALLLVFFLWMVYASMSRWDWDARPQAAVQLAEVYFTVFMCTQLIAVAVLTPAYVAGSIAEEKDRNTLEFMLATDLLSREIILSKFGARLANLAMFVLTGLPILSILQFLGGIDPNLVVAGFVATLMTTIGLGAYSMLCSVMFRKPRDAIIMAYLGALVYVSVASALYAFRFAPDVDIRAFFDTEWWTGGPNFALLVDWLNTGNLAVALGKISMAMATNALNTELWNILTEYTIFHLIFGAICLTWSIVRLRPIALYQAHGVVKSAKGREMNRVRVGETPMLWKEVHVEGGMRLNWLGWILMVLIVLLTVGAGAVRIYLYVVDHGGHWGEDYPFAEEMNGYVRTVGTIILCLMLLGVAVRASTSISSEMDKQTFDALITSPLGATDMLTAKLMGSVLSVRRAWLWIGAVWAMGLLSGGMHVFAVVLTLAAWWVYAFLFAMIGLWYSMVAKSSMRSTVFTLVTVVLVSVGHWLCCSPIYIVSIGRDFEYIAKMQVGMTPPAVLGFLQFSGYEFRHDWSNHQMLEFVGFGLFGVFVTAMFSLIFWISVLIPRFQTLTRREEVYDAGPHRIGMDDLHESGDDE